MNRKASTGKKKKFTTGLAAAFMAAVFSAQAAATPLSSVAAEFNDVSAPLNQKLETDTGYVCIHNINEGNVYIMTGYNDAHAIRLSAAYAQYIRDIEKRDPGAIPAMIEAAQKVGVDFELMLVKAMIESTVGKHDAPLHVKGGARGLFQYLPATWLTVFSWYGDTYEDGKYADLVKAIKFNKKGRPYVSNAATKKKILALRSDHKVASFIKAMHLKYDEAPDLREILEDEPKLIDYYMLHFLGHPRTVVFYKNLKNNPDAIAAYKMKREARYNRGLFYTKGKALTFKQVYEKITERLETRKTKANKIMQEELKDGKCRPAFRRKPVDGDIHIFKL